MKSDVPPNANGILKWAESLSEIELLRAHYCYHIGWTFIASSLVEDSIVNAMSICDKVRLGQTLGADATAWEVMLKKREFLQDSTLESLTSILSKHEILESDLQYLRWIKKKRNHFIHRFFERGNWPGGIPQSAYRPLCRELSAMHILFQRATLRIWKILVRAELLSEFAPFDDELLIVNRDFEKLLSSAPPLWDLLKKFNQSRSFVACRDNLTMTRAPTVRRTLRGLSAISVHLGHLFPDYRILWITRNFFSDCYPGVTQLEFSSRLVQKENPLSH